MVLTRVMLSNMKITKIVVLVLFVISIISATASAGNDAIGDLKSGNDRYVSGKMLHPRQNMSRLKEVSLSQQPKVAILSCSDSRVPPEVVFDQGIGDLFVVRVAGNVLNKENLGSIEYAIEHLGVKDIVVMGHSRCGAVTAAVEGGDVHGNVKSIINALKPAVKAAKAKKCGCDQIELAAHINVENAVKELSSKYKVNVTGAYYDLDSGKVEFLK